MPPFDEGSSAVLDISVFAVCELCSSLSLAVVGVVVVDDSDHGQ